MNRTRIRAEKEGVWMLLGICFAWLRETWLCEILCSIGRAIWDGIYELIKPQPQEPDQDATTPSTHPASWYLHPH